MLYRKRQLKELGDVPGPLMQIVEEGPPMVLSAVQSTRSPFASDPVMSGVPKLSPCIPAAIPAALPNTASTWLDELKSAENCQTPALAEESSPTTMLLSA